MPPIIEVRNLSKVYHLGQIGRPPLRELLSSAWDKVLGRRHPVHHDQSSHSKIDPDRAGPEANSFWALRNVSFDVEEGEVLGIIGRNGAGKSTLLKILSRITEPTSGYARLRGRVASLLEVGTGFHEELTGRENIYLNGTILGLKKQEIDARLDEIVDFSGVETFLDTPVKRYSSGMRVRLAFAVAAHLNPEILIIDEVLAVGDAEFQEKCLGKLERVSKEGRTVILVSHQLSMISQLSTKVIGMEAGTLSREGNPSEVLNWYSHSITNTPTKSTFRGADVGLRLGGVTTSKDSDIIRYRKFGENEALILLIRVIGDRNKKLPADVRLAVALHQQALHSRIALFTTPSSEFLQTADSEYHIRLRIAPGQLVPAHYSWCVALESMELGVIDYEDFCCPIEITAEVTPNRLFIDPKEFGIVRLAHKFEPIL